MSKNPIEGSQRIKKNLGTKTPLRVAPRQQPQSRVGGKKGGKRGNR